MISSVQGLTDNARTSAVRAVHFDKQGQGEVAAFCYREAAHFLTLASLTATATDCVSVEIWKTYAEKYTARAKQLQALKQKQIICKPDPSLRGVQQCFFTMALALDAEEARHSAEAAQLFLQAARLGFEARILATDPVSQNLLMGFTQHALERAEAQKGLAVAGPASVSARSATPKGQLPSVVENATAAGPSQPLPRKEPYHHLSLHHASSGRLKVAGGQNIYTEEEKRVLLITSNISGKAYVPLMRVDLLERFQYTVPFTDEGGPLSLSPKQEEEFAGWVRPDELCVDPRLVVHFYVDYCAIKQTLVSDCSFVASLIVSALHERRFGHRLITSIIYPQDRLKQPIYNPFGKYMIKLHINGIPRKVIIDDVFPIGKHGELLCSYSTNRNEFWVSVLEKAYMKVMGGYDFRGSNSNIDLHALTGWIPEQVAIRVNDADFNSNVVFENLLTSMSKGDVLVTLGTGELSSADEEHTGLVPSHAYAVLDARIVQGVRLLQLKNPWSHPRWRGNYSELDIRHWTPELKAALNYDLNSAAMFDSGIFWIDYESVLRFFDVFYLNWNPGLFSYTCCIHQAWKAGTLPIKDAYNIGDNPQFILEVTPETPGSVWILLTRHITKVEDFKENREYITVLVYKHEGRRVFYPYDPAPINDCVRINSPHYLCKINFTPECTHRYTLVVSQYEKMYPIFYTLRAFATCPFTLKKLENYYHYIKEISDGQWEGSTAGGCCNHLLTYGNNPQYRIILDPTHGYSHLLIDLKGPKQFNIGLDVMCEMCVDSNAPSAFKRKSSGPFRSAFVVLELYCVVPGTYVIIPSTFYPGQEGPFFLTIKSSCPFKIKKVQ